MNETGLSSLLLNPELAYPTVAGADSPVRVAGVASGQEPAEGFPALLGLLMQPESAGAAATLDAGRSDPLLPPPTGGDGKLLPLEQIEPEADDLPISTNPLIAWVSPAETPEPAAGLPGMPAPLLEPSVQSRPGQPTAVTVTMDTAAPSSSNPSSEEANPLPPATPTTPKAPPVAAGHLPIEELGQKDIETHPEPNQRAESAQPPLAGHPRGELPVSGTNRHAAPEMILEESIGSPRWRDEVGDKLSWMVGRNIQQAELRLNPPELGPLQIRLSINSDEASIQFNANHLVVRDAVEAALPRLREMLQGSGLNLVHVDVSSQGEGNQAGRETGHFQGELGGAGADSDEAMEDALDKEISQRITGGSGVIDAYV